MAHAHDSMFKAVFEDPACAREHFELVIPAASRRLMDLTTLELVPGSFVDEALRARHTDLLFRARGRGADGSERERLVYLLFEHQSTDQSLIVFRLLRYMTNIWDRHVATSETETQALPFPPIVAVVLYNGAQRWRAARSFHELMEPLGDMSPKVPQFEMVLTDLGACSDELLQLNTPGGRARMMMKHAPRVQGARSLARLGPIIQALATDRTMEHAAWLRRLRQFSQYVWAVASRIERQQVVDFFARHAGEDGRKMAMTLRDELRAEGKAEGRVEGQAALVLKLISLKFGAPDDATRSRVGQASEPELELWAERILTADSLESMFAE